MLKSKIDDIKLIKKFFSILPKKVLILFLGQGLCYLILYIVEYFTPLFQKSLIDKAIQTKNLNNPFLYFLIISYLFYLSFLLISKKIYIYNSTESHKNLFFHFLEKMTNLSKNQMQKNGTGYYFDMLSSDNSSATQILGPEIFCLIFSFLQSGIILITVYKWDARLSLIFGLSLILPFIILICFSRLQTKAFKVIKNQLSLLANETIDIFSNNFTVKLYNAFPKFKATIYEIYKPFYQKIRYSNNLSSFSEIFNEIVKYLGFIFLLFFSINLVIHDKISYGTLIAIISFYHMAFYPMKSLQDLLNLYNNSIVSIFRLNAVNEIKIKESNNKTLFDNTGNGINSLFFDSVSFSNNKNDKELLYKDITFEISGNKKIGIVGLSGEGKSSILQLLYRENKIGKGKILLNNNQIDEYSINNYYSFFNVYSQDIEIFNKDLIFNITLGKKIIKESQMEDEINFINSYIIKVYDIFNNYTNFYDYKKALKNNTSEKEYLILKSLTFFNYLPIANTDFINIKKIINTETSIVTNIGKIIFNINFLVEEKVTDLVKELDLEYLKGRKFGESGAFISGGEKQKITLARFLLKEDYSIFILDEPFVSLDAIAENRLLSILKNKLKNKMGIIISHKFNILVNLADEFIVLESNKITQRGTHQDLINQEGLYKKVFAKFIQQREL